MKFGDQEHQHAEQDFFEIVSLSINFITWIGFCSVACAIVLHFSLMATQKAVEIYSINWYLALPFGFVPCAFVAIAPIISGAYFYVALHRRCNLLSIELEALPTTKLTRGVLVMAAKNIPSANLIVSFALSAQIIQSLQSSSLFTG